MRFLTTSTGGNGHPGSARVAALTFALAPTDLANHLACPHLTTLDLEVAMGTRKAPQVPSSVTEALRQRGFEHETAYVDHLRGSRLDVVDLRDQPVSFEGSAETLRVMRTGVSVIVQAPLVAGSWGGRADILRRVERPSLLGSFSYEAVDTKLSAETKGGTILQLCTHADMLGVLQGAAPERFHVVTPGQPFTIQTYRFDDYRAYYRLIRARLEARAADATQAGTYPDPVPQCDFCRWWSECADRRRADDHLSLVAGISKSQISQLAEWSVTTLESLGDFTLPFPARPSRGSIESLLRVQAQARIQLQGRRDRRVLHEALPVEPGLGLCRLPAPSPGDIFLDLEGDPFVGDDGREYLFGYAIRGDAGWEYRGRWALGSSEERAAFEAFVDFVTDRQKTYADLHVFHYAPYEPTALKRLMGLYATRDDALDRLLRGGIFIDLYGIVRQSIRASIERYSIKSLEPLYRFARQIPLRDASAHLRAAELVLELGGSELTPDTVAAIESYNRDDCVSAGELRDWLECVRTQILATGQDVPRPVPASPEPSEALNEHRLRVQELTAHLLDGVVDDPLQRSPEQRARYLLAPLLDFYRREDKSVWWEFFRLADLPPEDYLDEPQALGDLAFVERLSTTKRGVPVDRYSFPPQECEIWEAELYTAKDQKFGKVVRLDRDACIVEVKKPVARTDDHPPRVFAHNRVNSGTLADSLMRLGVWVAENGPDGPGSAHRAARDLLLNAAPRLVPCETWEPDPGEMLERRARRLVRALDSGVLPVQGPPGSGKTYLGARMICELVAAGRKVAVTGPSHKVIRNLLDAVLAAAAEGKQTVRVVQKVRDADVDSAPPFRQETENGPALDALRAGQADVLGGTAWLWAREAAADIADVLFVDEAGQMSLANTLAVAQAARSLVLLGDPQQLEQVVQGCHPDGTAVSALHHALAGAQTLPDDRGLFLPETWRMHPRICAFTSEVFYEGRLSARAELTRQRLERAGDLDGAGLWLLPVDHEGNQNSAPEEVDAVAALVSRLLGAGWVNAEGVRAAVDMDDILIVAPYNAHVFAIRDRLPGARVGTVDRFQGQEAPIVIYSMAASSPADAPRGMEFLYSLNRLNVATSRARCAVVLVANPRLFAPDCRSPRQMRLANALCRFRELSMETAPVRRDLAAVSS
jgi:predicted RecB family nuclease